MKMHGGKRETSPSSCSPISRSLKTRLPQKQVRAWSWKVNQKFKLRTEESEQHAERAKGRAIWRASCWDLMFRWWKNFSPTVYCFHSIITMIGFFAWNVSLPWLRLTFSDIVGVSAPSTWSFRTWTRPKEPGSKTVRFIICLVMSTTGGHHKWTSIYFMDLLKSLVYFLHWIILTGKGDYRCRLIPFSCF